MKKIFALITISILCSVAFAQDKNESFGLLLDNSGSLRTQLVFEKNLAKEIVKKVIPRGDISVLHFATNKKRTTAEVSLGSDFSSDEKLHILTIDNLTTVPGQTALIDAILSTGEKINSRQLANKDRNFEKILIILTDGEDRSSETTPKELVKYLKEVGIKVWVIALVGELAAERGFIGESPIKKAKAFLNNLTKETNGRVVFPKDKQTVDDIIRELLGSDPVKSK